MLARPLKDFDSLPKSMAMKLMWVHRYWK